MELRIGHGYDIHRLVIGRKLILGGYEIPYTLGLLGHSDGDVLCHAIIDSLFGALGLPDIGQHYPDDDSNTLGMNSLQMLRDVWIQQIQPSGYVINNIDTTIVVQNPKLAPYIQKIKGNIAIVLGLNAQNVGIKAKTNEHLDATGQGHAIACHAVCLLMHI